MRAAHRSKGPTSVAPSSSTCSAAPLLPPEILLPILAYTQLDKHDSLEQQHSRLSFSKVNRGWYHVARSVPQACVVEGTQMAARLANELQRRRFEQQGVGTVVKRLKLSVELYSDTEKEKVAVLLELCPIVEVIEFEVCGVFEESTGKGGRKLEFGRRMDTAWEQLVRLKSLRLQFPRFPRFKEDELYQFLGKLPSLQHLFLGGFVGAYRSQSRSTSPSTLPSLTTLDLSAIRSEDQVVVTSVASTLIQASSSTLRSLSTPLLDPDFTSHLSQASYRHFTHVLSIVAPSLEQLSSVIMFDALTSSVTDTVQTMRSLKQLNLHLEDTLDLVEVVAPLSNLAFFSLSYDHLRPPTLISFLEKAPPTLVTVMVNCRMAANAFDPESSWTRERQIDVIQAGKEKGVEVFLFSEYYKEFKARIKWLDVV